MSDLYKNEFTQHSDIPLSHLDYGYIEKCNDVKELEKILKILRYFFFNRNCSFDILECWHSRRYAAPLILDQGRLGGTFVNVELLTQSF